MMSIVCLGISACLFAGCQHESNVHNTPVHLMSENDQQCPNLAGTYAFLGQGLPGMPDHFIFRSVPYTADVLLGQDLDPADRSRASEIIFFTDKQGSIAFADASHIFAEKALAYGEDSIRCEAGTLVIRSTRKSQGEWGSSLVHALKELRLDVEGNLVINIRLWSENRLLLYPWTSLPKEYGASFARRRIE